MIIIPHFVLATQFVCSSVVTSRASYYSYGPWQCFLGLFDVPGSLRTAISGFGHALNIETLVAAAGKRDKLIEVFYL